MGDRTIKRCKELITVKPRMAFTFGGMKENVIRKGRVCEGTFGITAKVLFLDLSDSCTFVL